MYCWQDGTYTKSSVTYYCLKKVVKNVFFYKEVSPSFLRLLLSVKQFSDRGGETISKVPVSRAYVKKYIHRYILIWFVEINNLFLIFKRAYTTNSTRYVVFFYYQIV